jgi:hypothetical protein
MHSILRKSGTLFLVRYLKEAHLVVQKYVSQEYMYKSSYPLGITAGLPSIIPGSIRLQLKKKDPVAIRGVLAFLSVFRVLKVPSILKLETITDPFKGISDSIPNLELGRVFTTLHPRKRPFSLESPLEFLRLNTAGPNGSSSVRCILFDVHAWKFDPLRPTLEKFITLLEGPSSSFLEMLYTEWHLTFPFEGHVILGKLSVKEEAAGKARVFAITDAITQSVLYPVHKYLFSLLRDLPMDGTFDQGAPLARLLELQKEGALKGHRFHSYDLSAATDRLPIGLQRDILGYYIGSELAGLWADLLTKRDWWLQRKPLPPLPLRYAVGQPMGALSSWAMLALTHHYIVQVAARRVGQMSFTHYAVLGDDIVIANDLVASSYHSLVTEWLGVDINLSKSLVSADCFEFAKRLVTLTGEVTPPGAKNVLLALKSLNGIPSLLLDLVNKGFLLSEDDVTEYFERIPSVRRKSALKELQWVVKGPFGFIPTRSGISSSWEVDSSLTSIKVDSLLTSIDDAFLEMQYRTWSVAIENSHIALQKFENAMVQEDSLLGFSVQLYQHILDLYKADFMRLVLDRPTGKPLQLYAPLDPQEVYPPGWLERAMTEIRTQVRSVDNRMITPIADPFQVERVVLPFSSSLKSFNFFKEVRRIDLARVIREVKPSRRTLRLQRLEAKRLAEEARLASHTAESSDMGNLVDNDRKIG